MYVIMGDLILRHSTIYQNSAGDEGGGIFTVDDTGRNQDNTEGLGLYLQNSIVAGSTGGGDCVARDDIDHNIGMYIGDGSCEPACSATDGPINLGELQGEPAYHPVLDGSIAINRADQEVCSLTSSSDTIESQQVQDFSDTNICEELDPEQDQIGTNRPMYGNCDIGAIESRTGVEHETIADTDPPTETPVPAPTDTDLPPPTATDVPPPTATDVPPPTATDVPPPADTDVPPPTMYRRHGNRCTAANGNRCTATSGYRRTATSGYRCTATSGYRCTATNGNRRTATNGNRCTATNGNRCTAASAGPAGAGPAGAGPAGARSASARSASDRCAGV